MSDLTEEWCRKNLEGYEIKEDAVAVEFVVAKCSNGSDAMVAFDKSRPSQKDFPRCFVSNFYVEHVKTVDDLRKLVLALGFGNDRPWKLEREQVPSDCVCGNPGWSNEECERCRLIAKINSMQKRIEGLKFGIGSHKQRIAAQVICIEDLKSLLKATREAEDRFIRDLYGLRNSLTDHYQCAVCKKWSHVEGMLRPHGNTEDLCCDEGCCEAWNDRSPD